MELDELKLIWDSQNQEPLYAMNEAALQRLVRRRTEEISRALSRCYLAEITIGVSCGGLMLVCAAALAFGGPAWAVAWIKVTWTFWDTLALLLASGLWFHYSTYMYRARQRQLQHNGVFEQTLRGDLDRALAQNEFQSMMAKKIVWWGLSRSGSRVHPGWRQLSIWWRRPPGPMSTWARPLSARSLPWSPANNAPSPAAMNRAGVNWSPSGPSLSTHNSKECYRARSRFSYKIINGRYFKPVFSGNRTEFSNRSEFVP